MNPLARNEIHQADSRNITPSKAWERGIPVSGGAGKQEYAVSRDGRFLLNEVVESTTSTPITLLLNWKPK